MCGRCQRDLTRETMFKDRAGKEKKRENKDAEIQDAEI